MMTISSLIEREREQKKGKKYYYINTIMLKNKNRGEKYKSLGILERPKFDYNSYFFFFLKFNMPTYFENLIVKLHVLYVLNIRVKFYVNRILFTINL